MLNLWITVESIPKLLRGALLTVELAATILALSLALALPVALCLNSKRRVIANTALAYIMLFRGTPALIQVFLVYYGSSQFDWVRSSFLWPIFKEPYWCAIIALSLNGAAYTGNIMAGAMRAVPVGSVEAAKALGLSWSRTQMLVVLPQAVQIAFPAYTNEVIQTLKATSLASTVTLLELTGAAQTLVNDTYAPYEVFLAAGAMYFVLTYLLTLLFRRIETRLRIGSGELAGATLKLKQRVEA